MPNLDFKIILLIVFIVVSLSFDITKRIIPNWLVLMGVIGGILLPLLALDISRLLECIGAIFMVFIILIIPFLSGGLGGGDVKMIMAIGVIMGISFTLRTIIYTAIIGGFISIGMMVYYGTFKTSIIKIKQYVCTMVLTGNLSTLESSTENLYFPYSIAIAMGAVMSWYFNAPIF